MDGSVYTAPMPSFTYIARTTDGTLERGITEALTAEEAREALRKKHLFVEELQQEEGPPAVIGFAGAKLPWAVTEEPVDTNSVTDPLPEETSPRYVPLMETLRLFAGWLLAWYGLIYLLGSFQYFNKIPWDIPFLDGLFTSTIVLQFTFGTFLFLFLTSIHKWTSGGVMKGLMLSAVFIALMIMFHLNV